MTRRRCRRRDAIVLVVSLMATGPLAARTTAAATPPSAPVQIDATRPPDGMQTGDVTDTTITVRALADLPRLEITVYVVDGLALLTGPIDAVFENVNAQDEKQFTVRVQLAATKGSLGITADTLAASGRKAVEIATVTYGLR